MLCTAETDTLSAEVTSLLGIAGCISVGTYESLGVFCSEVHDLAEVAVELRLASGHLTIVNLTCRTVE